MCIHGFVKFMQNLCSDLKVLRRIQGGSAGGGRRKRHHTFFFQINLQVNSASGFGRFVEARAVSAICVVSGTAEQLQIFLPKEVWCLFLLVDNPAVLDLCLAAQILTWSVCGELCRAAQFPCFLSFLLYEHEEETDEEESAGYPDDVESISDGKVSSDACTESEE